MPSPTYTLFRAAILAEQQVICIYDGRSRELCPHIIGTNKDGEEAVLAWQFAGESGGKLPQWRCLKIANVSDARARNGRWHEGCSQQDDAEVRDQDRSRYQHSRAQVAMMRTTVKSLRSGSGSGAIIHPSPLPRTPPDRYKIRA
jgi:hypothetical protein